MIAVAGNDWSSHFCVACWNAAERNRTFLRVFTAERVCRSGVHCSFNLLSRVVSVMRFFFLFFHHAALLSLLKSYSKLKLEF